MRENPPRTALSSFHRGLLSANKSAVTIPAWAATSGFLPAQLDPETTFLAYVGFLFKQVV